MTAPIEASSIAYEQAVERDVRRNILAFTSWEFVWGLGMPFAMFATFVPAYLGALDAPKALIGMLLAFPHLFGALQLLVGYWTPPARRLIVYRRLLIAGVLPYFLYAAAATLWGTAWPLRLHCTLYTIAQTFFLGISFSTSGLYWEIMTDTVPARRRGKLFGLRSVGVGSAGLAMGAVATAVLAHWPTPQNFRVAFLIGTSFFLVSLATLWIVRDHVNPEHGTRHAADRASLGRHLIETFRPLRGEPNYRIFIFFMTLLCVATGGAPFLVDAARVTLHVSAQAQGIFSLVYLGAMAALGWLFGALADRYGYRLVGCVAAILMAGVFLTCLTTRSLVCWYAAYGAYAITGFASYMLLCNMSAELCPTAPPNRMMALGGILPVPFVLTANTLGGRVADLTGSYQPVFIAFLVLSLVALAGFAFLVREPRSGRLYMLKPIPRG